MGCLWDQQRGDQEDESRMRQRERSSCDGVTTTDSPTGTQEREQPLRVALNQGEVYLSLLVALPGRIIYLDPR